MNTNTANSTRNDSAERIDLSEASLAKLTLPGMHTPVTTTRIIAREFGIRHSNLLKLVAKLLPELSEADQGHFMPAELLTDEGASVVDEYHLTHSGFAMLSERLMGSDVLKLRFVLAFVRAQEAAEREAAQRLHEYVAFWESRRHASMHRALEEALARDAAGINTTRTIEELALGFALTGEEVLLDRTQLSTAQLRLLMRLELENADLLREGVDTDIRHCMLRDMVVNG